MFKTHLKLYRSPVYPNGMDVVLRAIIFDLDGVLIDSEPLHFAAFNKALQGEGSPLSDEVYKENYLALDDKGAFARYFEDERKPLDLEKLNNLMKIKSEIYLNLVRSEGVLPYPSVPEFVRAVAARYPLAVATGSRRHEAELLLESAGLRPFFEGLVTSDDVKNGKPNPESYLKAVELLNSSGKRPTAIKPEECAVIEDSKQGIASAQSAGMKCVGVSTSYPAFELSSADLVVSGIASLRISQVEDLFLPPKPLHLPSPHSQN